MDFKVDDTVKMRRYKDILCEYVSYNNGDIYGAGWFHTTFRILCGKTHIVTRVAGEGKCVTIDNFVSPCWYFNEIFFEL